MVKILIVDDEPDLDVLIQQRFRNEIAAGQYRFYFARDGEHALKVVAKQQDIDIVASDLNMPQMNGFELLRILHAKHPHIQTMIVSAYSDMENISLASQYGAAVFITKPIRFDDFEDKLKELIKKLKKSDRKFAK